MTPNKAEEEATTRKCNITQKQLLWERKGLTKVAQNYNKMAQQLHKAPH